MSEAAWGEWFTAHEPPMGTGGTVHHVRVHYGVRRPDGPGVVRACVNGGARLSGACGRAAPALVALDVGIGLRLEALVDGDGPSPFGEELDGFIEVEVFGVADPVVLRARAADHSAGELLPDVGRGWLLGSGGAGLMRAAQWRARAPPRRPR